MSDTMTKRFERYVAIGDSSTEGLDDPDGSGGYRGWANRLAERLAQAQGTILYANLGVRGRTTREIREQQFAPALAMRPDLATLFSGTNDVLARRFEVSEFAADVEHMQRALAQGGATVLTFTLPDLTPLLPLAAGLAPRIRAMNEALKQAASRTGAIVLDFAAYPVAVDPRLWSEDRIHANALGHERIAHALAHALGLPDADDSWRQSLPAAASPTTRERLATELTWARRHLLPWMRRGFATPRARHAPKRPELRAMTIESIPVAPGPAPPVTPLRS
jgi:lysophospholipase L1-like esterase